LLWRPRWSSTHGYAQPHDDGISLGVVEKDLGSVVPSLASGRCSRTTTHGGIVAQHGSLRVTVVVSSVTIASTTATPLLPPPLLLPPPPLGVVEDKDHRKGRGRTGVGTTGWGRVGSLLFSARGSEGGGRAGGDLNPHRKLLKDQVIAYIMEGGEGFGPLEKVLQVIVPLVQPRRMFRARVQSATGLRGSRRAPTIFFILRQ
jgi:hypothetical protein